MKLICIMPVRNEDWVLGLSARAVLMWCDELVVLNHASIDGTPAILDELKQEYKDRLTILEDRRTEWYEMERRQALLTQARKQGATHIALVDADEVLTGNLLPDIRAYIQTTPGSSVMSLPWQCLRGSLYRVHTYGTWGDAIVSTAFLDAPSLHWSAAERGGYEYHHRHPMGRIPAYSTPIPRSMGGLMHLQFVSDWRLRAKQALYKMQEVVRWPGRSTVQQINDQYNLAVYDCSAPPLQPFTSGADRIRQRFEPPIPPAPPPSGFGDVPANWWAPYHELLPYLSLDAEPWQEVECHRLAEVYGLPRFAGLDLFGIL